MMKLGTMKDTPILYTAAMVRAILIDHKKMTRRLNGLERVNARINDWATPLLDSTGEWVFTAENGEAEQIRLRCPYGQPGDRLWVRETFAAVRSSHGNAQCFCYRADDPTSVLPVKYKPSIHMPRWASRITLEITGVKVERVNCISGPDVVAEGIPSGNFVEFLNLWDSINAKRGYGSGVSPWVWAISFKRI